MIKGNELAVVNTNFELYLKKKTVTNSYAAFRLQLAILMVIYVHLRKPHLPERHDQVESSVVPIN